ncbi:S4 domain-containing protein, partial [Vibrio sp. 1249-1]
MRLDKYLCDALGATRKQATKIIKSGEVLVDGEVQKSGSFKV